MLNFAGFPMHEFGSAYHVATESFSDRLVSQANTEQRDLAGKMANKLHADPALLWSAGRGRDQNSFRAHRLDFGNRDLIVAPYHRVRAQFTPILDQVVCKRIVVVENKDHGRRPR